MSLNRILVPSLVAGLLSLALVAGCGKKGPLYLPPPAETPATQGSSESSAPAQSTEQDGSEASSPATTE